MRVQYQGWPCEVRKERYAFGGTALLLIHATERDLVAKATIYVEGVELAPDEVVVKDYSENAGMLAVLTKAGVVEQTGRVVALSYGIQAPICRVLI